MKRTGANPEDSEKINELLSICMKSRETDNAVDCIVPVTAMINQCECSISELIRQGKDFLTKKLVELHGGILWAESEGEGKGSKFTFIIPM